MTPRFRRATIRFALVATATATSLAVVPPLRAPGGPENPDGLGDPAGGWTSWFVPAVRAQEEDPVKEAAERVELARPMVERGQYADAERQLRQALEADATNVDAALLLADVRSAVGKLRKAADVLVPFTNSAPALTRRAELLLGIGEDEAAEAAARKALELDAADLPARRALGLVLETTGRREAAVAEYAELNKRWAASDDEDTDDELLAVARARRGIFELSDEYRPKLSSVLSRLEPIVKRSPRRVDVLVELSDLYLATQQDQDAKKWYTKALAVNAQYAPAIFGLAKQKAFRYDTEGARSEAERALRVNASYVPALLFLADMELGDGNYERAEEHIEAALAVNPVHTDSRSARAALHYLRGDESAFTAEVSKILERDRYASAAFMTLGRVLEEQRRFAEALEFAERAMQVNDRDWHAYFLAGRNAMNVGDDAKAAEYLTQAEKGDPYNNIFRTNFIKLYRKMDRFPERRDARFVVKLPPAEEEAYLPLLRDALDWSLDLLEQKWGFEVAEPTYISVFDQQADFATRTIGLPGFPALGACFGRVVTLDSPRALPPGAFGWRGTLHHELAHAVTLQLSKGRVPRWLTEGISVYEERKVTPMWNREMERDLVDAIASDAVLTLAEINGAFRGPRVMFAYYQGGLMCEFIERDFGFEKLREMVRLYGDGLDTPAVVRRALGVEPTEFDAQFLRYAREYVADIRVLPRPSNEKMRALKKHLRREKHDVEAHILYSLGHVARGNSSDALSAIGKAAAVKPDDPRIAAVRALVAARERRTDTAVQYAAEAVEKGTDVLELRMLLAGAAQKDEDFEKAKEHLRAAIDALPFQKGGGDPRLALAKLLMGEGEEQLPAAMQLLQEHANVDEDDFGTRMRLASWHREAGRPQEELRLLLEVRDTVPLPNGPFDRNSALELHARIGELSLERKDYAAAELSYRTAVGVARMDTGVAEQPPLMGVELAELLVRHAESLHLLGRKADARRAAEEALIHDPENDEARELLDRIDPE